MLGPLGEILFSGGLQESIQWADKNLEATEGSDSDDDQFETGLNLRNSESSDDQSVDF